MKFLWTCLILLALLNMDYVRAIQGNVTCMPVKFSFTAIDLQNPDEVFRLSIDYSMNRLRAVKEGYTYVEDLNTRTVYETDSNGNCRSYEGTGDFYWQQCYHPEVTKVEQRYFGPGQEVNLSQITFPAEQITGMTIYGFAYNSPYGLLPVLAKDVTDEYTTYFFFTDHILEIPDPESFQLPSSC